MTSEGRFIPAFAEPQVAADESLKSLRAHTLLPENEALRQEAVFDVQEARLRRRSVFVMSLGILGFVAFCVAGFVWTAGPEADALLSVSIAMAAVACGGCAWIAREAWRAGSARIGQQRNEHWRAAADLSTEQMASLTDIAEKSVELRPVIRGWIESGSPIRQRDFAMLADAGHEISRATAQRELMRVAGTKPLRLVPGGSP